MNFVEKIFTMLLHFTWGFPQTILAWILLIVHGAMYGPCKIQFQKDCAVFIVTNKMFKSPFSLGVFIFKPHRIPLLPSTKIHEYGHTMQALALGPAYLLIVGIPSAVWNYLRVQKGCFQSYGYYSFYTEKWAEAWGMDCAIRGAMK